MESLERLVRVLNSLYLDKPFIKNKLGPFLDDVEKEHDAEVERLREKVEDVQDALHALYHELLVTKLESIPIPKDDDGRLIQHNDRMEWRDGKTFTVIGFGIEDTLFYIDDDGSVQWTNAKGKRHHEEDVRDVLMEFATEIVGVANRLDDHEVTDAIDEYAGKLQLKEPSDD